MKEVALISNGDFRDAVGVNCWPKQEETLQKVEKVFKSLRLKAKRAHPYKEDKKHGFITTQAEGCRVFSNLNPDTPVVVILSSWVWASNIASSLKLHKGPILLLGNFDGTWPGLVSLLNHSATLERMSISHAKIWTDAFIDDSWFMEKLKKWIETGSIEYSNEHITNAKDLKISGQAEGFCAELAHKILKEKKILGQMDPGCMGMLNAVISPDKTAGIGMPVEYLNQSDLLAEMKRLSNNAANEALSWLEEKKTNFHWGSDPDVELTENQVLEQMKMYIAAGRIFKRYGLSAIGIPYQYGLVRCTGASDLPEGMLNNGERPPIIDPESGDVINRGLPIVHFNEGDVGSAIPQVLMNTILLEKKMPPETTLHDVRWGCQFQGKFIWVFEVSGGAPPAHWGGWRKTHVYRQPPMYFPLGGGTCSGVSKPGVITWARFYESFDKIGMDVGTGEVVELPSDEVKRRQEATTKEWPIANVIIPGYGKNQLMSSHKSNHITICYGDILPELVSVASKIGIDVNVIGDARKKLS